MKIWTEKLFHQCASRIDEVFRPNFHSERDQEKNYKLHFLNQKTASSHYGYQIHQAVRS
jgi:hypothetical protein